ncbi:MAG TPA: hypothetical protein PKM59_15575 [Thermodesulfobacteriota bacterium]|nr:hypothetical protein [Thermodesulfobacteriota bacterium]HNU72725.1 hypothetical protein [Thermodesulfobacteriota bacterium]
MGYVQNHTYASEYLGWSLRRIERETGVRRETIAKYVRYSDAKAAISPTGSLRVLKCDTGLYWATTHLRFLNVASR